MVHEPTADLVSRALIDCGGYRIKSTKILSEFYMWKSGIRSPTYTNCRDLQRDAGARAIVCSALKGAFERNFPKADLVVGVAEAGIMLSAVAADRVGLPHAFIRKTKKEHGLGGMVECSPEEGARAVIIDDLLATGESVERAIEHLAAEKRIETVGVLTVVNWDFPEMRERFRRLDVPVRALASYPHILSAAANMGLITSEAVAVLTAFYRNPRQHVWTDAALDAIGTQPDEDSGVEI